MELGIVINELNENLPVMDANSFNVSFAVDRNFGDCGYIESGLGAGADTDQRRCMPLVRSYAQIIRNRSQKLVYNSYTLLYYFL